MLAPVRSLVGHLVALAALVATVALVAGCSSRRPPLARPPSAVVEERTERGSAPADSPVPSSDAPPGAESLGPRVVRRIVAEQRDLVARSQAMTNELPDPGGRARAQAEVDELDRELARITDALAQASNADGDGESDVVDAAVSDLLRLDTRLSLLHERLRIATERTTAVLVD